MNCNDCGGFLPRGCDCSPFGGRKSREDEAYRKFQRERIEEARRHDAEEAKKLPLPVQHGDVLRLGSLLQAIDYAKHHGWPQESITKIEAIAAMFQHGCSEQTLRAALQVLEFAVEEAATADSPDALARAERKVEGARQMVLALVQHGRVAVTPDSTDPGGVT